MRMSRPKVTHGIKRTPVARQRVRIESMTIAAREFVEGFLGPNYGSCPWWETSRPMAARILRAARATEVSS